MPDLDAALQILGSAVNAPPPSAAAPAASAPVPSAADLQSLAASRPDAYQPSASEAQAMSADLAAIAARQNASPPADPLDNAMGILAQGAAGKLPPLAPPPPPGKISGPVANVGAGFNQTLASTLGAPVDLLSGMMSPHLWNSLPPDQQADYVAQHPIAGSVMQAWSNATAHPIGGTESIDNLLGAAGVDPRNVMAGNSLDQVARAAGGGVAGMVLPYAGARTALAAGADAGPVLNTLANGSLSSNAAIGAGAGVGGYAGSQAVPKPYAPLGDFAGQLLGGGLVGGVTAAAKGFARGISDLATRYAGPFNSPSMAQKLGIGRPENLGVDAQGQPLSASPSQQRVAAQRILDASSNPAALPGALDDASELVPGSAPTTYQATGDAGLGQLERTQATRNPDLFTTRRAEQNAARVGSIEDLAPDGNAEAVSDLVNRRLADLDAQRAAAVTGAEGRRNAAVGAMGGQNSVGEYGAGMRGELAAANDAVKQRESALWEAIDPTGTKTMAVGSVRKAAQDIPAALTKSAKAPSGEEAAIYETAQRYGNVEPYAEIKDLRSRTLAAIRAERKPGGDLLAMRRLQQFRQSLDDAISGAVQQSADQGPQAEAAIREALSDRAPPSTGGTVYTPSGRAIGVKYDVVDANQLVPSHTDDLRPNPSFPAELQPRERTRVASEAQITRMAGNLQPERLGASASAMEGAPIVGPDGVVESGNARVLAIRKAYQQGGASAQAYRDFLERQGYDTSDMLAPVLVRRRVTDLSPTERVKFAQEANANPGLSMSATEQAMVDAKRLPDSALELYRGGDVDSRDNRDFSRAFIRTVAQRGEEGSLVAPDGTLSVQGQARIRNALLAKAYRDSDLIGALAETGDPDIAAFGKALTEVAPKVAQLKSEIAAGRVQDGLDVAPALTEAASVVRSARAAGIPLRDAIAQSDAFSHLSPEAEEILKAAYGPSFGARFSRSRLSAMIGDYVEEARKQTTDGRLFGENATQREILQSVGARHGRTDTAAPQQAWDFNEAGAARPSGGVSGEASRRSGPLPAGAPGAATGRADPSGRGNAGASLLAPPSSPANFGPSDYTAYRAAADVTRGRKATFGSGPVGDVLRPQPSGEGFKLSDYEVPGKFFRSGAASAADVDRYFAAVGDSPRARDLLNDYMAMSLRRAAVGSDSSLSPSKYASWMRSHADALSRIPGAQERFESVAAAQDAVETANAAHTEAIRTYRESAAKHFLGGVAPADAVARAFKSQNPTATFSQLAGMVAGKPEARAGLQRAVVDYMMRDFRGTEPAGETGVEYLKSDGLQKFIRKNTGALRWVFGQSGLDNLQAVAQDLQRTNPAKTKLAASPGTAQDLTGVAKHAAKSGHGGDGNIMSVLIGLGLEHGTGHIMAALGGAVGVKLANTFRAYGLQSVDDLVTQAMLNPTLARSLLAKLTPETRAAIVPRLNAQMKTLSGVAAVDSTDRDKLLPPLPPFDILPPIKAPPFRSQEYFR